MASQGQALVVAGGDGGGASIGASHRPARGHACRGCRLKVFAIGGRRGSAKCHLDGIATCRLAADGREVDVVVLTGGEILQGVGRCRRCVTVSAALRKALRAVFDGHLCRGVQAFPLHHAALVHFGGTDGARRDIQIVEEEGAGICGFDFQRDIFPRAVVSAHVAP